MKRSTENAVAVTRSSAAAAIAFPLSATALAILRETPNAGFAADEFF